MKSYEYSSEGSVTNAQLTAKTNLCCESNKVKPSLAERALLKLVSKHLDKDLGTLHLTLPSGYCRVFGKNEPHADLSLKSLKSVLRLVTGGTNGWSEGYLAGEWDSSNLSLLIKWALRYEASLENLASADFINNLIHNLYHRSRDNNRQGSRRNIAAHYDLGNDFYKLWLDPGMTYSAALFEHSDQPLEQAQTNKYARILDLLEAKAGDSIAEIGCGWGGFAEQAAATGQLHVQGVTLSTEQLAWAQQRIAEKQLDDQVSLSLTDYRDLRGQFDGIVSIEMFEAVGEKHWDSYFETLKSLLKPGGKAVLQIITIEDQRFQTYRKRADFIQRYIFPGGMLPSIEALQAKFDQHGFKLETQQMFGQDYALTLKYWAESFEQSWSEIKAQGFDERFYRMWRYYLAYCQGGFEEGAIDVGLFVISQDESKA